VKFAACLLRTSASIGALTLLAAPAVSLAEPQEPRDDQSGAITHVEKELDTFGRLAEMPEKSRQRQAISAYNLGLESSDKASELDEQAAATAHPEKAAKKAAKAQKSYKKAIEQFRTAVELVPDFYQALGSLGYALLQTGQYEEALEAYDRALAMGPVYPAAIEERGEVYLGLDRIEEAKKAYLRLFRADRRLAAKLMTAMKRWVDQRRGDAGGLSEEVIESFAVWIEKRS